LSANNFLVGVVDGRRQNIIAHLALFAMDVIAILA